MTQEHTLFEEIEHNPDNPTLEVLHNIGTLMRKEINYMEYELDGILYAVGWRSRLNSTDPRKAGWLVYKKPNQ